MLLLLTWLQESPEQNIYQTVNSRQDNLEQREEEVEGEEEEDGVRIVRGRQRIVGLKAL